MNMKLSMKATKKNFLPSRDPFSLIYWIYQSIKHQDFFISAYFFDKPLLLFFYIQAPVRVLQCPDKSKSVEVFGEIVVNCPKSGLTGHLEFLSTQDPLTPSREVRGAIMDAGGRVMATMHGHWESVFGFTRQDGGYVSLWTINYGDWLRHPFGMSDFSLQLNNQPGDTTSYPASDSRYRPDVRSFEMGCYEDAAALKKKVEAEKVGNPQKGLCSKLTKRAISSVDPHCSIFVFFFFLDLHEQRL